MVRGGKTQQSKKLWEAYQDALKKGMTSVSASNDSFYTHTIQPYQRDMLAKYEALWEDCPKEPPMEDNMRNIVTLILAGLARANGGSIAIGQADLGEVGDRIHLEADSVTGLITITLLPDYVKVGIEPELEVKPKTQFTIAYDPATTTTTNTPTITYKAMGPLTLGSGSGASYKLMVNGIEQPGTFVNDSANSFEWHETK